MCRRQPDPLTVITGGGTGNNDATGFIITDTDGLILGLPAAGPFDLDGAGVGTCEIWYIRYQTEGFSGQEVGNNLSDLMGCFDLSNPITVVRQAPDGGTVSLADGGTDFIGCAGDIVFDVTHTTEATALSYWYIITDDNDNILGFHNSADGPTLDLSGAPAGTCRIWGWSYRGLPDPVVGEPLSSIAPDGSCADISDEFITVYREVPDGGTITTTGGAADTTVVAGDAFVTVTHTTSAQFLSYWYIITDEDGTILGFQNSTAGNTLDLSGAPAGTCRIWGWSYRGLPDPVAGENISTLTDDFCETISENFVNVVREEAECDIITNDIMLDGGGTATSICVDGNPDPLTVITGGGTGNNDATGFIITDTDGLILGLPAAGPFDLDGAGVGTCEIWYIRYQTEGFSGQEVGNNLSDLMGCFDLSNPITVVRQAPDGGTVSLADGGTDFIGCAGDIVFDVTHTTEATALSYWYIITDDNDNILGFHNSADRTNPRPQRRAGRYLPHLGLELPRPSGPRRGGATKQYST